jgi:hypothetical protein
MALIESKFNRNENAPELNCTDDPQLPPVSVHAGTELLALASAPCAGQVPTVEGQNLTVLK